MKEKISKTLSKISSDTPTANSANTSETRVERLLGDPNCPHCRGVGYVRFDVPMGDPKFGRQEACVCRTSDIAEGARNRLFEISRLDRLSHLTFENFEARGNKNAKFMTPQDVTQFASRDRDRGKICAHAAGLVVAGGRIRLRQNAYRGGHRQLRGFDGHAHAVHHRTRPAGHLRFASATPRPPSRRASSRSATLTCWCWTTSARRTPQAGRRKNCSRS